MVDRRGQMNPRTVSAEVASALPGQGDEAARPQDKLLTTGIRHLAPSGREGLAVDVLDRIFADDWSGPSAPVQ